MVKKAILVYQAGIANVFEVESFNIADEGRNARRCYQGDFHGAIWYARGLAAAGCIVRTAACNQAGDIAQSTWTLDLDSQPFSDRLIEVSDN